MLGRKGGISRSGGNNVRAIAGEDGRFRSCYREKSNSFHSKGHQIFQEGAIAWTLFTLG